MTRLDHKEELERLLFLGAIAMANRSKTDLSEALGVKRSKFSDMLHARRRMPEAVKLKLIQELGLDEVLALLDRVA